MNEAWLNTGVTSIPEKLEVLPQRTRVASGDSGAHHLRERTPDVCNVIVPASQVWDVEYSRSVICSLLPVS